MPDENKSDNPFGGLNPFKNKPPEKKWDLPESNLKIADTTGDKIVEDVILTAITIPSDTILTRSVGRNPSVTPERLEMLKKKTEILRQYNGIISDIPYDSEYWKLR